MSMRADLTSLVAAGAASITEGVQEPHEVVNEILDKLMRPTDGMIASGQDGSRKITDGEHISEFEIAAVWIEMIRAAKAGK